MRLLLIWLVNALSLLAVAYVLPSVTVDSFYAAVITALLLAIVNTVIRPLLVIITLPINILTLGLFTLVINGLMFWFAGSILRGFMVDSFWSGVLGAVLYSIFSWALSSAATQLLVRKHGNQHDNTDQF